MRLNELQVVLGLMKEDRNRALREVTTASDIALIGNGGSAAIASHIAVDFTKNCGRYARAFNDASLLTCFANDYGYDQMFVEALRQFGRHVNLLIAISSSGKSKNIINAAVYARKNGCRVITMSGFDDDNPLRSVGDVNVYVPSHDYGIVEITHLAILHSMVPV